MKINSIIKNIIISVFLFSVTISFAVNENSQINNSNDIEGQAVIKSKNEVAISSQIDGKINSTQFREGEHFKKGDTIITFDCRLYQADYDKAKAELEKYRSQYASNKKLRNLDGLSDQDLAQSKGDYEQSVANTQAKAILVEQCNIIAPFSGSVSKLHVNNHQTVKAGELLVELVDDQTLEIEMLMPSTAINYLKIGKQFVFTAEDSGKSFKAKITKIVPKIDPISKSIKVIGVVENNQSKLLPGMSGIGKLEKN